MVTSNVNGDRRLGHHYVHSMVGCRAKLSRAPCTDILVTELSDGIVAERTLF